MKKKPTLKQLWWGIKQNNVSLSRQCLKYALYDCLCEAEPMFVPADFCHNQQWLEASKTIASLNGTVVDYKKIAQADANRLAAGYVLSDEQWRLVPELVGELNAERAMILAPRWDEFYHIPNYSNFFVRLLIAELNSWPDPELPVVVRSHIDRMAAMEWSEEDICLLWKSAEKSPHLQQLAKLKTFNLQRIKRLAELCKALTQFYNDNPQNVSLYFKVLEYIGTNCSKSVTVLETLYRFINTRQQYTIRAEKVMLKILKANKDAWDVETGAEFKKLILRMSNHKLLCLRMINLLHPANLDLAYLKLVWQWCEKPCDDSLSLLSESAKLLQRTFKYYPCWAEQIYFACMDLLTSFSPHLGANALIDKDAQEWHFERSPFPPALMKVLDVYFAAAASKNFTQVSIDNYERLLSFVHYAKLERSSKLEKQFAHLRKVIPMDCYFFISPIVALYHNLDVSEFVREMIAKLLEEKIIYTVSLDDLRKIALQDFALRLQIDDNLFWEKRRQREQKEQKKETVYAKKAAALLKKLELV